MILYCDTSALLKLYVREPESGKVRKAIDSATALCTHVIAYAELRAALAKAWRMGRISVNQLSRLVEDADKDWSTLRLIGADMALVREAGDLAQRHGLKGFDSVHLAAALAVGRVAGDAGKPVFAAFDRGLAKAALAEGLTILG